MCRNYAPRRCASAVIAQAGTSATRSTSNLVIGCPFYGRGLSYPVRDMLHDLMWKSVLAVDVLGYRLTNWVAIVRRSPSPISPPPSASALIWRRLAVARSITVIASVTRRCAHSTRAGARHMRVCTTAKSRIVAYAPSSYTSTTTTTTTTSSSSSSSRITTTASPSPSLRGHGIGSRIVRHHLPIDRPIPVGRVSHHGVIRDGVAKTRNIVHQTSTGTAPGVAAEHGMTSASGRL